MKTLDADYFVVGSGMAGLMTALHLAAYGKVVVATKGRLAECNTNFVQGGICCVMDPSDSFDKHARDTMIAGAWLGKSPVVHEICEHAPEGIQDLIDCGVKFACKENGDCVLKRDYVPAVENSVAGLRDATGNDATFTACVNTAASSLTYGGVFTPVLNRIAGSETARKFPARHRPRLTFSGGVAAKPTHMRQGPLMKLTPRQSKAASLNSLQSRMSRQDWLYSSDKYAFRYLTSFFCCGGL